MPQVTQLGSVEVRVDDGALTDSSSITVQALSTPILQIGNGETPASNNQIQSSNGLDLIFAGPPGEFHYVLGSGSTIKSFQRWMVGEGADA